jgi:hypothetical protein
MRQYFAWIIFLSLILLVLGGCASRGDFTALSGKNVNLSNLKVDKTMSKGRTSGEDCTHIIIFIPTSGPPTLEEALDQALEAKQANLLLDAVVKWHTFYIPLIYGQTCWHVEGMSYDTFK